MFTVQAKLLAKAFLKKVESYRSVPYLDSAGIPTDGYGNTHSVRMGMEITPEVADSDLDFNINTTCKQLYKCISDNAILKMPDHEQAALIAFSFNVGANPTWTIWKLINTYKFDQVPGEMMKFTHVRNPKTKQLEVCKGLVNRRSAEVALWHLQDVNKAVATIDLTEIAPNTLAVHKEPDQQQLSRARDGVHLTLAATLLGGLYTIGQKFGISPHLTLIIVGIVIGCVFVFAIALALYFYERKNPRFVHGISLVQTQPLQGFDNMTPDMQTAINNLVAAANTSKANAVAAIQTQLDAANAQVTQLQAQIANDPLSAQVATLTQQLTDANNTITTLQNTVNNGDSADVAAVNAAQSQLI